MDQSFSFARAGRAAFSSVLLAATFSFGCGAPDQTADEQSRVEGESAVSSASGALSSTAPTDFASGLSDLAELGSIASKAFSGPSAVFQAYQFLNQLTGAKSFEQRTTETLNLIRSDISDVAAKVAQGQTTVSSQLAAQDIALAIAASANARAFVVDSNGAVYDVNVNPAAALADANTQAITSTFMDDSWYSEVSPVVGAPRQFEWRLGLPHLIAAITMRLDVMAAIHPDFVSSGRYSAELLSYYDNIGNRLNQADQALIVCYNTANGPFGPNPADLPIRACFNAQNGHLLPVGTLYHPIPDAVIRARLMNEMGFDRIRSFRDGLYALAKGMPKNSSFCAQEYQTCSTVGTKTARYGANGGYFYRTERGSFACGNATFGDPISGPIKSCAVGDLARFPCASESGNCYFRGVKAIRYGANNAFYSKLSQDGLLCANSEFGDPAVGATKACDYADPVWTQCAVEGGTCSVSGTQYVRFGYGDNWLYRKVTTSFTCNNSGGDPAVGQIKVCEIASLP